MPKLPERQSYHHGTLRSALIEAADAIIQEGGIEAFSLREAARRANVSPGAPAHHFGNTQGLLTEVALRAYEALGQSLAAPMATDAGEDRTALLRHVALAYVRFAVQNPGHFRLMFRNDLVNRSDPRYQATASAALGGMVEAIRALTAPTAGTQAPAESHMETQIFGVWSTLHGMAHLVLEDKARYLFDGLDASQFVEERLPSVLAQLWPRH